MIDFPVQSHDVKHGEQLTQMGQRYDMQPLPSSLSNMQVADNSLPNALRSWSQTRILSGNAFWMCLP